MFKKKPGNQGVKELYSSGQAAWVVNTLIFPSYEIIICKQQIPPLH